MSTRDAASCWRRCRSSKGGASRSACSSISPRSSGVARSRRSTSTCASTATVRSKSSPRRRWRSSSPGSGARACPSTSRLAELVLYDTHQEPAARRGRDPRASADHHHPRLSPEVRESSRRELTLELRVSARLACVSDGWFPGRAKAAVSIVRRPRQSARPRHPVLDAHGVCATFYVLRGRWRASRRYAVVGARDREPHDDPPVLRQSPLGEGQPARRHHARLRRRRHSRRRRDPRSRCARTFAYPCGQTGSGGASAR